MFKVIRTVTMSSIVKFLSLFTLYALASLSHADFLPPDQAFQFKATSLSNEQAELKWEIAPNYYLYHDQFKVSVAQKAIPLNLPAGHEKDDPTFGITDVHYKQVTTQFAVKPNQSYQVQWQGCSEDGLCYPVQRMTIQTDASGLLPQQGAAKSNTAIGGLLNQSTTATSNHHVANIEEEKATTNLVTEKPTSTDKAPENLNTALQEEPTSSATFSTENNSNIISAPTTNSSSQTAVLNDDQFFLNLLSGQSIVLNMLVFLLLGVLLAFLPCSLPLIPILSGILVQRNKGYKAVVIALTFVVCMALVYAAMGIAVSQLGSGVQRWFQNPIFISVFAILFVVFALNLFGLYQLSLPQSMLQRLDKIQQRQKGGTLVGAGVMGAISALIVGPCMSAPLAGALLYVSHLEHSALGGFYLFLLGLGIGIPLFIASVFGSKYLPKPGLWMDRLKFSFGFVMLAMAIYFARPLLPTALYYCLLGLVLIAMAGYLLGILRYITTLISKSIIVLLACSFALAGGWQINQAVQHLKSTTSESLATWTIVTNQQEFEAALAKHAQEPVIIDVYADWCVACQPIERDVIPRLDVQDALKNVTRIKLDLTHYEASQDVILKEWQILGPPTMLFVAPEQQERRALRLTGTFNAPQLINNIQRLHEEK